MISASASGSTWSTLYGSKSGSRPGITGRPRSLDRLRPDVGREPRPGGLQRLDLAGWHRALLVIRAATDLARSPEDVLEDVPERGRDRQRQDRAEETRKIDPPMISRR